MRQKQYLCIDFKSFYASVECVERGLDPLKANLVVADPERGGGTICLAVSPSMKALGVKNRCRVYEIPPHIQYIKAVPRMQLYIDYTAKIYGIYLRYFDKNDIHVYSVDEAFIDVTAYLPLYKKTARGLARALLRLVRDETGICATCGIGENLYLAKIALDIVAKRAPDFIGELTEESYREKLWDHRPLTDFWRISTGIAGRLQLSGIGTMRQLAAADEDMLYRLFGIDAELLIDHAWGRESATIADIKAYRAKNRSLSRGQVLLRDYDFEEGGLIVKEMTDLLCLDLVNKSLVTACVSLNVGYTARAEVSGARGSTALPYATNSDKEIIPAVLRLYARITDPEQKIRRIQLCCGSVQPEGNVQLSLFGDRRDDEKETALQKTVLEIKRRYGKNAILKGMNYEPAATTRERNLQIGGHKSGENE